MLREHSQLVCVKLVFADFLDVGCQFRVVHGLPHFCAGLVTTRCGTRTTSLKRLSVGDVVGVANILLAAHFSRVVVGLGVLVAGVFGVPGEEVKFIVFVHDHS